MSSEYITVYGTRQMNLAPKTHKATNIQSILKAFKAYVMEQLGGKTENELWLERIDQIPKNDFNSSVAAASGKCTKLRKMIRAK